MALHSNRYPCIHCPAHFETKQDQADHLQATHAHINAWLCHECSTSLPSSQDLSNHMRTAHRWSIEGSVICNFPGATTCQSLASSEMAARHKKHDHLEQLSPQTRGPAQDVAETDAANTGVAASPPLKREVELPPKPSKIDWDAVLADPGARFPSPPPFEDSDTSSPSEAPPSSMLQVGYPPLPPPTSLESPAQPQPSAAALPPLPDSIYAAGLTPDDFNPRTIYQDLKPKPNMYKDIPTDVPNAHIFNADPKLLCYGNILLLATKYTRQVICDKANEGRRQVVFNGVAAVDSRVTSAKNWAVTAWKMKMEQVQEWYDEEKRRNGLMVRIAPSKGKKREREEEDERVPATFDAGLYSTPSKRVKLPAPQATPPYTSPLMGEIYNQHVRPSVLNFHPMPTQLATPEASPPRSQLAEQRVVKQQQVMAHGVNRQQVTAHGVYQHSIWQQSIEQQTVEQPIVEQQSFEEEGIEQHGFAGFVDYAVWPSDIVWLDEE